MKINKIFLIILLPLSLVSCMSIGPDGRILWGIKGDPCSETYKQVTTNYEVTVDLAKKANANGKITQEKLVEISEDAANYRAQARDLCTFFYDKKITFEQYQQGIAKNDDQYRSLKTSIPH